MSKLSNYPEVKSLDGITVQEIIVPEFKDGEWKEFKTTDAFSGKKVIVFGLPGAFTPTCSASMLPDYSRLEKAFKEEGINEIYVSSVNDSFVMNAWLKEQEIDNIKPISDGNGDFTKSLGLLVNKLELAFGPRSWRYSLLIIDGVIEKSFIEPNEPGDPFEVSDAHTMLEYLAPGREASREIAIVTKDECQYCISLKKELDDKSISYQEIVLGKDIEGKIIRILSGSSTYPQVFINGDYKGGSEAIALLTT